jgi:DNA-binding transcriptional MerR regulator
MQQTISIGQAARALDLTVDTLRYYEKLGVVPQVPRRGGKRSYSPEDIDRIGFLLKLRATGMPLDAMIRYVALARGGARTVSARRALLQEQAKRLHETIALAKVCLTTIDAKIARLAAEERGLPLPEDCVDAPRPKTVPKRTKGRRPS